MGKPKNVVPMTLSVPKDLKTKMEAVTVSVNWSAVASAAFEAKLLNLESKKEVASMHEVIARWKAADELDRNEEYQKGWEAGERWAKQEARPKQLRALATAVACPQLNRSNIIGAFIADKGERVNKAPVIGRKPGCAWALAQAVAGKLAYLLQPSDLGPYSGLGGMLNDTDVALFWTKVLGEEWKFLIEERDFAQGFLEGALETWQEASGKL
jgi:hypothetical protein